MTKKEVLNAVIKITRNTGQGLSGIVGLAKSEIAYYLDELENEGKIEKYTIYNSYLPNDIWYLPKGIYSVWSDKNYMKSLSYIRKYLKIESFNDLINVIEKSEYDELLIEYDKWVNEHKVQLEEIVNLKLIDDDTLIDDVETKTNNIQTDFIFFKEKNYYKNNLSLRECIYKIKEDIEIEKRIISLYNELLIIHKQMNNDSDYDKDKNIKIKSEKELKLNVDFANWLNSFDEKEKIQNIL